MTADCEHRAGRGKGDFIEEDYNIIRGVKRRVGIAERAKVQIGAKLLCKGAKVEAEVSEGLG
jgi:hypothetical protein